MHVTVILALLQTTASGTPPILQGWNWWDVTRIALTILTSGALLAFAYYKMVRGLSPTKSNLGNFVAFNAVAATLIGVGTVVVATSNWTTMLLVSGACLGSGFLFGLLFGYPLSSKPVPSGTGTSGGTDNTDSAQSSRNLFQQSADSLSKVVAGATLVQAQTLYNYFILIAGEVSKCAFPPCCPPNNYTFGAAVMLYFLILGFLAGLLLPHFYDLIEAVPGSPDSPDNPGKTINPLPDNSNPQAPAPPGILNIPPPEKLDPATEPTPAPAPAEPPQQATPGPPDIHD